MAQDEVKKLSEAASGVAAVTNLLVSGDGVERCEGCLLEARIRWVKAVLGETKLKYFVSLHELVQEHLELAARMGFTEDLKEIATFSGKLRQKLSTAPAPPTR